ncbi:MAG: 50S ribosomal protein L4 [Candidatus Latescibacterota bacterium]|nr:50S ribosomal protein L4 [Candidatus Latescibacterota bacterium]
MASVDVVSTEGQKAGAIDLPAGLFEGQISEYAVHSAVVAYETNQRQGNASVKGRSEVSRSKRKHHRQKGTGSARRGTVSTNLLRGGGVSFSLPKPRSYRTKLPRAIRRLALRSALTAKEKASAIVVIEDFDFPEPKTKSFVAILEACGLTGHKLLVITGENHPVLVKSGRNIPGVEIRTAGVVGTYDIVAADTLLLTRGAVEALAKVHGDGE